MKFHIPLIAVAALMSLSACSKSEPEVVGGPADPLAHELANAAPVTLPPSVKTSNSYRCKDNSLLFVEFLSDDKSANLRTKKDGAPTKLVADAPGGPLKGDGYEVSGPGKTITATVPGKAAQSCKA